MLTVCVQGLGFVGSAMAVAVADTLDHHGVPLYEVIGVDLPTPTGQARIDSLNSGIFPFVNVDAELDKAMDRVHGMGNLSCTSDPRAFGRADIIIVDVHFDIGDLDGGGALDFDPFKEAIAAVGRHVKNGALVIIETTVPPGTCEKIVAPTLAGELTRRGLPGDCVHLAHSYERVMPGEDYYRSIKNFWRVYAGLTSEAADACERFLTSILNTRDYPLTRLHSTTASETAKVLENSYRAVNIAFIHEWGQFAQKAGVNLFEVIDAIRMRPTHSDIREPGFGVGGYCLSKDPLFAPLASKSLLNLDVEFPFSTMAVKCNAAMPQASVDLLREMLTDFKGRRILLLGVSYRPGIGDTRHTPSRYFVERLRAEGATVVCHDPLVSHWDELNEPVLQELPSLEEFDAVVFAVSHVEYKRLDAASWRDLNIIDAARVLGENQIESARGNGCRVVCVGRGN